jgi:hypothetical protein
MATSSVKTPTPKPATRPAPSKPTTKATTAPTPKSTPKPSPGAAKDKVKLSDEARKSERSEESPASAGLKNAFSPETGTQQKQDAKPIERLEKERSSVLDESHPKLRELKQERDETVAELKGQAETTYQGQQGRAERLGQEFKAPEGSPEPISESKAPSTKGLTSKEVQTNEKLLWARDRVRETEDRLQAAKDSRTDDLLNQETLSSDERRASHIGSYRRHLDKEPAAGEEHKSWENQKVHKEWDLSMAANPKLQKEAEQVKKLLEERPPDMRERLAELGKNSSDGRYGDALGYLSKLSDSDKAHIKSERERLTETALRPSDRSARREADSFLRTKPRHESELKKLGGELSKDKAYSGELRANWKGSDASREHVRGLDGNSQAKFDSERAQTQAENQTRRAENVQDFSKRSEKRYQQKMGEANKVGQNLDKYREGRQADLLSGVDKERVEARLGGDSVTNLREGNHAFTQLVDSHNLNPEQARKFHDELGVHGDSEMVTQALKTGGAQGLSPDDVLGTLAVGKHSDRDRAMKAFGSDSADQTRQQFTDMGLEAVEKRAQGEGDLFRGGWERNSEQLTNFLTEQGQGDKLLVNKDGPSLVDKLAEEAKTDPKVKRQLSRALESMGQQEDSVGRLAQLRGLQVDGSEDTQAYSDLQQRAEGLPADQRGLQDVVNKDSAAEVKQIHFNRETEQAAPLKKNFPEAVRSGFHDWDKNDNGFLTDQEVEKALARSKDETGPMADLNRATLQTLRGNQGALQKRSNDEDFSETNGTSLNDIGNLRSSGQDRELFQEQFEIEQALAQEPSFTGDQDKPADLKGLIGSRDYYFERYKDFRRRNPEDHAPDYYIHYGAKYFDRFQEMKPDVGAKTRDWIDGTATKLHEAIDTRSANGADFAQLERDPKAFKKFAYDSHPNAYLEGGLNDVPLGDLAKIPFVPDAGDLVSWGGVKQAVQTGVGFGLREAKDAALSIGPVMPSPILTRGFF